MIFPQERDLPILTDGTRVACSFKTDGGMRDVKAGLRG